MGKWSDYLIEIEKQGLDWTDPLYLVAWAAKKGMVISSRSASQIIDSRKAEIDNTTELEEAKREWEELNNGAS